MIPRGSAVYQRVVPSLSVIGNAPCEYATSSVSGSNATDRMLGQFCRQTVRFANRMLLGFKPAPNRVDGPDRIAFKQRYGQRDCSWTSYRHPRRDMEGELTASAVGLVAGWSLRSGIGSTSTVPSLSNCSFA